MLLLFAGLVVIVIWFVRRQTADFFNPDILASPLMGVAAGLMFGYGGKLLWQARQGGE